MVLEGLRKAYLKHKLKKVSVEERGAYEKEIADIQSQQDKAMVEKKAEKAAEQIARETEVAAYRQERVKQASIIGHEKARIETQKKLQAVRTGQTTKAGFLGGFDKFLAGTGVAKGTASVMGHGGIGNAGGFNVMTGYAQRSPSARLPIRRVRHHKKKSKSHKRKKVYYTQPSQPSYNIVTGAGRRSFI